MRETTANKEESVVMDLRSDRTETEKDENQDVLERSNEVEVIRWDTEATTMKADVWMNDGSIEGKVPKGEPGKDEDEEAIQESLMTGDTHSSAFSCAAAIRRASSEMRGPSNTEKTNSQFRQPIKQEHQIVSFQNLSWEQEDLT